MSATTKQHRLPVLRRRGCAISGATLCAAALACLALVGATRAPAQPQPGSGLVVGIADQRSANLGDPRLIDLPVRHARLSVPWDAMRYRWQRAEIDDWMRAAEAARMVPLVTFGRSRTRRFSLPPTAV